MTRIYVQSSRASELHDTFKRKWPGRIWAVFTLYNKAAADIFGSSIKRSSIVINFNRHECDIRPEHCELFFKLSSSLSKTGPNIIEPPDSGWLGPVSWRTHVMLSDSRRSRSITKLDPHLSQLAEPFVYSYNEILGTCYALYSKFISRPRCNDIIIFVLNYWLGISKIFWYQRMG